MLLTRLPNDQGVVAARQQGFEEEQVANLAERQAGQVGGNTPAWGLFAWHLLGQPSPLISPPPAAPISTHRVNRWHHNLAEPLVGVAHVLRAAEGIHPRQPAAPA